MRRISLALTLVGTVAITACSGSTSPVAKTDTGVAKGVPGTSFYVNIFTVPVGGRIASVTAAGVEDGKINCGEGATPLACGVLNGDGFYQTSYAWADTVRLKAVYATGMAFISWGGDCGGAGTCTLDTVASGADKTVAAIFGLPGTGHGNAMVNPAVHGPEFRKFIAGQDGALQCTRCHGSDLLGRSIAPSCASCHPAPSTNTLLPPATGLNFAVTSLTSTSTGIVVQFTVKDDGGKNIDLTGADGKNTSFVPRFGLASFSRMAKLDAYGRLGPYTVGPYRVRTSGDGGPGVLTPPAVGAAASPTTGQLTGTPGTYTYAFPPVVTFDPASSADTHTLWIQGSRQENLVASSTKSLTVRNYQFNFIPGALDAPVTSSNGDKREVVSAAACSACHDGFKSKGLLTGGVFHGGGRVDGSYCAVCHNPASTRTQEGTLHGVWRGSAGQFIHNIHASAQMGMPTSEMFTGISAATYPQPVMNCTACHAASAAQGAQWKTRPTIEACGSCHVNYPYPHNSNSTGACEGCHTPDAIEWVHVPIVPKDYTNSLEPGTGVASNTGTNASAIQAAGQVIPGASWIKAVIQSITTTSTNRPVITFKLQKTTVAGYPPAPVTTDVVFNTPPAAPDASAELMNDFIGTVGVYVVFSLPQDGIETPADFNVSVISNVKLAWMNVAGTGADATTLSGPVGGYYAITFPNLLIPGNAVNLTGGIGYAYELPGTQPLAQISVDGSAWSNNMYKAVNAPVTSGTVYGQACSPSTPCALKTGGLIAPIPNVWKAAGAPRRSIVDNAKCNGCHAMLGVGPTFHVGQRNDAPSCSFCHNPNQNRSGWSSNASTFVHAIHGAGKRTVDYGWTASCPTGSTWSAANARCEDNTTHAKVKAGFAEVEYPQSPANCSACHTDDAGSYAFQGVAVGNLLWTTAASETMGAATGPSQSPYVELGTNYGPGFAVSMGPNGGAPAITPAAATTLVTSPITAACFSCHDGAGARTHMTAMGGSLYKARGAVSTTLDVETCLHCHGVGRGFDVVLMHR